MRLNDAGHEKNQTHIITLSIFDGMWIADMSALPDAAEIMACLGTLMVPTPYSSSTPFAQVAGMLKRIPANTNVTFQEE